MQFTKPALTFDMQADLLIKRGLIGNKQEISSYLKRVNYYKLSAYWVPFTDTNYCFEPETTFEKITKRYKFDSILRNIVLEAVNSVEVYLKTYYANTLSLYLSPFFYTEYANYKDLDKNKFDEIIAKITNEYKRSREPGIKNFKFKYGDKHKLPPAWVIIDVISFGSFAKLVQHLKPQYIKQISKHFNLQYKVFTTWLWSINELRNICAHHSRLYNCKFGFKPSIPKIKEFLNLDNKRLFFAICMLLWFDVNSNWTKDWFKRLKYLLSSFDVPKIVMGFTDDWEETFECIISVRSTPKQKLPAKITGS